MADPIVALTRRFLGWGEPLPEPDQDKEQLRAAALAAAQSGDQERANQLSWTVADLERRDGRMAAAGVMLSYIADQAEGTEDWTLLARCLAAQGEMAVEQKEHALARKFFHLLRRQAQRGPQPVPAVIAGHLALADYALGMMAREEEHLEEAEDYMHLALSRMRRLGSVVGEGRTLYALAGLAARNPSRQAEAAALFQAAMELQEQAGLDLAGAYTSRMACGQQEFALDNMTGAYHLWVTGLRQATASSHTVFAEQFRARLQHLVERLLARGEESCGSEWQRRSAAQYFLTAKSIAEQTNQPVQVQRALWSMARLCLATHQLENAARYLQEAEKCPGDEALSTDRAALAAELRLCSDDPAGALEHMTRLTQALRQRGDSATAADLQTRLLILMRGWSAENPAVQAAPAGAENPPRRVPAPPPWPPEVELSTVSPEQQPTHLLRAGARLHAHGRLEQASTYYRAALSEAEALGDMTGQAQAASHLALLAYDRADDRDTSIRLLDQAEERLLSNSGPLDVRTGGELALQRGVLLQLEGRTSAAYQSYRAADEDFAVAGLAPDNPWRVAVHECLAATPMARD